MNLISLLLWIAVIFLASGIVLFFVSPQKKPDVKEWFGVLMVTIGFLALSLATLSSYFVDRSSEGNVASLSSLLVAMVSAVSLITTFICIAGLCTMKTPMESYREHKAKQSKPI
jgi:uncharacterized membrane protein YidH (DUF202 family)